MSAVAAPRPVLVTRPAGRGETLFTELERRGIEVVHQPLIRLVAEHGEELDAALARLRDGAYTHLVVTSRTAAEVLAGALVPPGTAVHAVGKGTAEELRRGGIPVSHVAAGSGAELVEETPPALAGASVLFPASAAASRTVPEGLRARGYRVHEVTAYRPVPVEPPAAVAVGLATGRFGALALTSPMIARRAAALGVHASTPIVTIGDPTSAAVRTKGLAVALQAHEPTDTALAQAVQQVLQSPPPPPIRPPQEPR